MMTISNQQILDFYNRVRELHPLVHCITNAVTVNDCANILLAAGASPTMAHHPEEVSEITSGCKALVCNFGALCDYDAMLAAAKTSTALGHPIVVDPVGCGGSSFRRRKFMDLAANAKISCVRGNASEIQSLARDMQTVTGVDGAMDETQEAFERTRNAAMKLAGQLQGIVVASGAIDIVTDGTQVIEIDRGSSMMAKITGAGCMGSALLGAYLSTENSLLSAAASCSVMCICGEIGEKKVKEANGGTMTFRLHMIDAMSLLTESEIMGK